jgi:tetratricopeptide (TPR) repeat protein
MSRDLIGPHIESLIRKRQWKQARVFIEKQLRKEPEDHWLWCRLSGVRYEQRSYQGALEAAEKALEIVPDCPLALWSKAGAVEMLGRANESITLYASLTRRGLEQLKDPDEDANECWEGADWTSGLVADCLFRSAGCLSKVGQRDKAIDMYRAFLSLADLGTRGIYSRKEALDRLNKLVPSKKARRQAALKIMDAQPGLVSSRP